MKFAYKFSRTTAVALALCVSMAASAELNVVTTLSTFADIAESVGGDHVSVSHVAPADFNPHFIDPRPSDVLRVKRADAFVHGGLGLEVWREALVGAAGNAAIVPGADGDINLAEGIVRLNVPAPGTTRSEGDVHAGGNPHYWLDPENAIRMAQTIAESFSAIDPGNASSYEANRASFEAGVRAGIERWQGSLAAHEGAEFLGYHDQWPYLAKFLGLKTERFLEPKPGIPPGPKHLRELESYIADNGIRGILWSKVSPSKSANNLSKRAGVPVVQLAQGVGEVDAATDYVAMIDYNVAQLKAALGN